MRALITLLIMAMAATCWGQTNIDNRALTLEDRSGTRGMSFDEAAREAKMTPEQLRQELGLPIIPPESGTTKGTLKFPDGSFLPNSTPPVSRPGEISLQEIESVIGSALDCMGYGEGINLRTDQGYKQYGCDKSIQRLIDLHKTIQNLNKKGNQ